MKQREVLAVNGIQTMKKPIIALISILFVSAAYAEYPEELIRTIEFPPPISANQPKGYPIQQGKGGLLENKDFICYLELSGDVSSTESTYRFRTFSKKHKLEVSGTGKVHEHYYSLKDPNQKSTSRVIDKGSNLIIDAGLFTIGWSAGRWLYADADALTVTEATEKDYEARVK